jgi:hypothetical protein
MQDIVLQLDQLKSPNKDRRFDACEHLRIAASLPLEAIQALEQASHDLDVDVADAARRALLAHREDESNLPESIRPLQVTNPLNDSLTSQTAMLKQIRSWGIWSLILGTAHILASGFFSASWGILLLMIGLASFAFRTASMFIVYFVILAWVAFNNILSGASGWMIFAMLQLYFAVSVFLQFRRFRQMELRLDQTEEDNADVKALTLERSKLFFPWISPIFSCSSMLGIVFLFVVGIVIGATHTTWIKYWAFAVDLMMNLGVLGFAVGLASLLSRYHPKLLAIIGMIVGLLIMILDIALFFFIRSRVG